MDLSDTYEVVNDHAINGSQKEPHYEIEATDIAMHDGKAVYEVYDEDE